MSVNQVDDFMRAIVGVESSGRADVVNDRTGAHGLFQIMPNNYDAWSKETFGRVVDKTPANQTAIARNKMMQYYNQFGDWDAVAVAWFAGPGRAKRYKNGDRSVLTLDDGGKKRRGTTVADYITKVRNGMGQSGTATQAPSTLPSRDAERLSVTPPEAEPMSARDAVLRSMEVFSRMNGAQTQGDEFAGSLNDAIGIALDDTVEGEIGPDDLEDVEVAPTVRGQAGSDAGGFNHPLAGAPLRSGFGPRNAPKAGASKNHAGLDFAARTGTPIEAAWGGTVSFAASKGGYGRTVVINHPNGRQSLYAHQSALTVKAGQQVSAGQIIGQVGSTGVSTGPHLHFEVRVDGRAVDPRPFMGGG